MDTSSEMKKTIILLSLSTIFLWACEPREYEYATAYVYKTGRYHWGRGYFKLQAYYRFEYNGQNIEDRYKYPKLGLYYMHCIEPGDSLVVKYPKGRPDKNEVIRIIRSSPKQRNP